MYTAIQFDGRLSYFERTDSFCILTYSVHGEDRAALDLFELRLAANASRRLVTLDEDGGLGV